MKNSIFFSVILYILGIALIGIFFFVLFEGILPEKIFWIDLVVSCFIYTLFIGNMTGLFTSSNDMDGSAGLAIRWFFTSTYTILAGIAMITLSINDVVFKIHIAVQAALFLFLIFGFYFSMVANQKTKSVDKMLKQESQGLNRIKELINRIKINISTKNPNPSILKELDEITESFEYMTISNQDMAIELENMLINELSDIINSIPRSSNTLNSEDLLARLQSCNIITKQRKNLRYIKI